MSYLMAPPCTRPTCAEVSRTALRSNYRILREQAARPGADVVGVIKANAYGHGAVETLSVLAAGGCDWVAVTWLDGPLLLHPQLKAHRTLILSGLFASEARAIVEHA